MLELLVTLLVCSTTFNLSSAYKPVIGQTLIHLNTNEIGMETGALDTIGWPLNDSWIQKWASPPWSNSIVLRSYLDSEMLQFDLNDQQWPTGWAGMFNPHGDAHYNASKSFRVALAHLTDKVRYISDILKGYGIALKVPLPPSLNAYVYEPSVDYIYSLTAANQTLYDGGFYYEGGLWKWGGIALPKLKIYIRLDDPIRRAIGNDLASQLKALGFSKSQLQVIVAPVKWCQQFVIDQHDYNIYTGAWNLDGDLTNQLYVNGLTKGVDPDNFLYDLYHSSYHFAGGSNYPGWCYSNYDAWAEKIKYAPNESELRYACWNATKIFFENEPTIPLCVICGVKAYKRGSTGVVNFDGLGVDNSYTFLRMSGAAGIDGRIDYGIKGEPKALHVISSSRTWDWKTLGLIYEGLIGRNPYELSVAQYFLATDYAVGTWDGGTKTKVSFTPRAGVTWHDGVAFTVDDIIFSWEFTKACGAGVAWNYASIADMNHTAIEGGKAVIYYNVLSMFAKWWAGGLPIIPKHIWEAQFPDWSTESFNPASVRAYRPWEVPTNYQVGGQNLTKAVGTGPWIYPYKGWTKGTSIKLIANANHYLTTTTVNNLIADSFWKYCGDADRDGEIGDSDIILAIAHYGENYPPCDFNENGIVDALDISTVTSHYGKVTG